MNGIYSKYSIHLNHSIQRHFSQIYRVLRKYSNLMVVICPDFDYSKFTYLCKKQ